MCVAFESPVMCNRPGLPESGGVLLNDHPCSQFKHVDDGSRAVSRRLL